MAPIDIIRDWLPWISAVGTSVIAVLFGVFILVVHAAMQRLGNVVSDQGKRIARHSDAIERHANVLDPITRRKEAAAENTQDIRKMNS